MGSTDNDYDNALRTNEWFATLSLYGDASALGGVGSGASGSDISGNFDGQLGVGVGGCGAIYTLNSLAQNAERESYGLGAGGCYTYFKNIHDISHKWDLLGHAWAHDGRWIFSAGATGMIRNLEGGDTRSFGGLEGGVDWSPVPALTHYTLQPYLGVRAAIGLSMSDDVHISSLFSGSAGLRMVF